MKYTLHTDESGEFEGDLRGDKRLIAGLVLPSMAMRPLAGLRREFEAIAKDEVGVGRIGALHASGAQLSRRRDDEKDALVQRMLECVLDACAGERRKARLIWITHKGSQGAAPMPASLLDPAFAANRYQRMLAELVRQVCMYVPGPETGDELALHIAKRIFKVKAGQVAALESVGYSQHGAVQHGMAKVRFGSKESVRAAFQTLMAVGWVDSRVRIEGLEFESISKTTDPRFVMVDFLANYIFRKFGRFSGEDGGKKSGLPSLEVFGLEFGASLEAMSRTADALNAQDVGGALDELAAVRQPVLHEPLEADLLRRLRLVSKPALRRDPRLADRLLDRAEHILDYRDYGLLNEAQRLARVVAGSKQVGPTATRRAYVVSGTVSNHQGRFAEGLAAFDSAIAASDCEAPTLESFLMRMDLENRRAVAQTNIFDFELEERLTGQLKVVEALVRKALGDAGRERVAGELAGTLAQAAVFRRDWRAAKRYFDKAARHLGDDHMQASFRAHAAIERKHKKEALQAALEALGSSYGREGYNCDVGQEQLADATGTILRELHAQPFKSWLVLKLIASGMLDVPGGAEVKQLSAAFRRPSKPHHPHMLVRLAAGHVLVRAGESADAIKVWERAYRESRATAHRPTQAAIRLQFPAHLTLVNAASRREPAAAECIRWSQQLREDATAMLESHPKLAPWFGDSVRQLEVGASPSEEAIRGLLDRFRFTYTS